MRLYICSEKQSGQKGEISTLVMMLSLIMITIGAFISSSATNKNKDIRSRAEDQNVCKYTTVQKCVDDGCAWEKCRYCKDVPDFYRCDITPTPLPSDCKYFTIKGCSESGCPWENCYECGSSNYFECLLPTPTISWPTSTPIPIPTNTPIPIPTEIPVILPTDIPTPTSIPPTRPPLSPSFSPTPNISPPIGGPQEIWARIGSTNGFPNISGSNLILHFSFCPFSGQCDNRNLYTLMAKGNFSITTATYTVVNIPCTSQTDVYASLNFCDDNNPYTCKPNRDVYVSSKQKCNPYTTRDNPMNFTIDLSKPPLLNFNTPTPSNPYSTPTISISPTESPISVIPTSTPAITQDASVTDTPGNSTVENLPNQIYPDKCLVDWVGEKGFYINKGDASCIEKEPMKFFIPGFGGTEKLQIKKTCLGSNKWGEENCTQKSQLCIQSSSLYNAKCEPKCKLLQGSGNLSKYDLLVLADGYSDFNEFLRDAKTAVDMMNKTNLGKDRINKINFWALNEIGNTYTDDKDDFLKDGNTMAQSMLSSCGGDGYLILKQSPNQNGYSVGVNTAFVSTAWLLSKVVPHELGHGIANLMDEWGGLKDGQPITAPAQLTWPYPINCSNQGASIENLPCPKWANKFPIVGCYHSCYYSNFYKPTTDSIMNASSASLNDTFNFNLPSLIDGWDEALKKYP